MAYYRQLLERRSEGKSVDSWQRLKFLAVGWFRVRLSTRVTKRGFNGLGVEEQMRLGVLALGLQGLRYGEREF